MTIDRTLSLHAQLVRTHDTLRQRLYDLVAALGTGDPPAAADGATTGRDLLEHCLGFCAALTTHHTGEDGGLFAALRRARPDLGPTLDRLTSDHHAIAEILARVDTLARRAATAAPAERAAIVRELDGLTAIMTSHFGYEERALRAALDDPAALGDDVPEAGWVETVFTPASGRRAGTIGSEEG